MIITPAAYLRRRREAAGLSLDDVAARLTTEPRMAEHVRKSWLELIERGDMPATFSTIVVLRWAYPFDLSVLERLAAIDLAADLPPPRLCRVCACSEADRCVTDAGTCAWVDFELCSLCFFAEPARAATLRRRPAEPARLADRSAAA